LYPINLHVCLLLRVESSGRCVNFHNVTNHNLNSLKKVVEPIAQKWNVICEVKGGQICIGWLVVEIFEYQWEKRYLQECYNSNAQVSICKRWEKVLNWGEMCVPLEWVHAFIYSGRGGITVSWGPSCAEDQSQISHEGSFIQCVWPILELWTRIVLVIELLFSVRSRGWRVLFIVWLLDLSLLGFSWSRTVVYISCLNMSRIRLSLWVIDTSFNN
jgi:hypothetical protein